MDTQDAKNLTEQAGRSDVVRTGARIGHAANGLLHLIVAYLIAQLALGSSQEDTDQSGALSLLGQSALGAVLLWVVIAGLVLLAVWQITEAVTLSKTSKRISAAGKAVVDLVIAGVAFFIAIGSSTSSGTEEEATGTALSMPGGQFLVAIAAIVILAIGGYHIYSGATAKFLEDLDKNPPASLTAAGRIGYIAKGIALLATGSLFGFAAWQHDAEEAGGLADGIEKLRELPFGTIILLAIAVGFAAYGIYSFAKAKYAKV